MPIKKNTVARGFIRRFILPTCFFYTSMGLSFDWEYYIKKNEVTNCPWFGYALDHFIQYGIPSKLQSTPVQIENTNFDWEYYTKHNNLQNITTEQGAYSHYIDTGKQKSLPFCQSYKIVILFHLYGLELMDEFIEKINQFMANNNVNDFYIKISIPVDDRIFNYADKITDVPISPTENSVQTIVQNTPYHRGLINNQNAIILHKLSIYISDRLHISKDHIQFVFSENRGADIGGFLLLLDQMIKQNFSFDFLVKIHTKRSQNSAQEKEPYGPHFNAGWREVLTSFLNIRINKILRNYECIYSCKLQISQDEEFGSLLLNELCDTLKISPSQNFEFCAGTMFLVSYKFLDFMRRWDLYQLFCMLNLGKIKRGYENIFERLFGNIFCLLQLKTLHLDYYPADYPVVFAT